MLAMIVDSNLYTWGDSESTQSRKREIEIGRSALRGRSPHEGEIGADVLPSQRTAREGLSLARFGPKRATRKALLAAGE